VLVEEFEESICASVGAEDAAGEITGVWIFAGRCVEPGYFQLPRACNCLHASMMEILTSRHKHLRRRSSRLEPFSWLRLRFSSGIP